MLFPDGGGPGLGNFGDDPMVVGASGTDGVLPIGFGNLRAEAAIGFEDFGSHNNSTIKVIFASASLAR